MMMIRGSLLRGVESAMAVTAKQHQQQQQHRRFAWQAVLTKVRDPATGEFKYRDWDEIMAGARDPMKGDQSLLERYQTADRHTKRTTLKKQLRARIHYERKMKQVDDLIRYVLRPCWSMIVPLVTNISLRYLTIRFSNQLRPIHERPSRRFVRAPFRCNGDISQSLFLHAV
jgi:hypothetical protein